MAKPADLTGQRFGLLVAAHSMQERTPAGRIKWKCICDCGGSTNVTVSNLRGGLVASCGCNHYGHNFKHGAATRNNHTAEYTTWLGIKNRCNNPNEPQYKYYGARGIKVCERWMEDFSAFYADMGEKPKGYTIDRINNDADYSSDNCRWATRTTQARNRRSTRLTRPMADSITRMRQSGFLIREIAEHFDVSLSTVGSVIYGTSWKES